MYKTYDIYYIGNNISYFEKKIWTGYIDHVGLLSRAQMINVGPSQVNNICFFDGS